jgi:hypothetical protein
VGVFVISSSLAVAADSSRVAYSSASPAIISAGISITCGFRNAKVRHMRRIRQIPMMP